MLPIIIGVILAFLFLMLYMSLIKGESKSISDADMKEVTDKLHAYIRGDIKTGHTVNVNEYFEKGLKAKCNCGCDKTIEELEEKELFEIE